MRPVVSYDDITEPVPALETNNGAGVQAQAAQLGPHLPSAHQPPTKRRRTNQSRPQPQHQHQNRYQQRQQRHVPQHWDEPGGSNLSVSYGGEEEEEDGEEEDESRELTHEEIWDDSALIDAWNSASAEYEEYHGKGDKTWQQESVKKSPLWYNVPPDLSKKTESKGKGKAPANNNTPSIPIPEVPSPQTGGEGDSEPLDFNTYVPSHDPSLAPLHPPNVPGPDYAQYYLPPLQGPMVSQDEAFQRALSAMYWGGYWTAVYHCQRQTVGVPAAEEGDMGEEGEIDEDMQEELKDDDFVSTQR